MTSNVKTTAIALQAAIEAKGYTSARVEVTVYAGGYANDNVHLWWTDLMDERQSRYFSATGDNTLADAFVKAQAEVYSLPTARDALNASAAAMVQRVRSKLIDAGFEEEVWMAQLSAIVDSLSGNALTHDKTGDR